MFWLTFIQTLPQLSTLPTEATPQRDIDAVQAEGEVEMVAVEMVADAGAIASQVSEGIAETQLVAQAYSNPLVLQPMATQGVVQPLAIGQPSLGQPSGIAGPALIFPGMVITLIMLLLMSIWGYTRVYTITPNNEAFVRTGGVFVKRKMVILNGGCIVLPGFHELTRVPLREISIDVVRTDKLAVRTQDYLRANMRVTFYVCISASEDDVLTAAARLSSEGTISPTNIKNALEKRADDAIRAAAKTKRLTEIDSDKLGFAQEVLNLMEQDLKKVGLTLNNIAISEIEESDSYDPDNFFDAQGVRLRTETIQRSIQQKREVELTTQVKIESQELDAERQTLTISKNKEEARLDQKLELDALRAQRKREIQEAQAREHAAAEQTRILQEKAVEEEEIRRKFSVQQSQIEADIDLEERQKALKVAQALQRQESEAAEIQRQRIIEEAEIQRKLSVQQNQVDADIDLEERNKALKVAQAIQQQEAEVAEVERQKSVEAAMFESHVELAEAERASKVAQQDAAIAIAERERDRFAAEAERAQAEEAVVTATAVEQAQREQQLVAIEAEQEAEKQRISKNNVVEIEVFRRRRQAEIARQAADLEAEALRTLADAERDKALAEAEGINAKVVARNAISNANLTADVVTQIWPELSEKLPAILQALAPQPGVIGDARVYSFPGASGAGGSGAGDINKLLLSTSGLALINSLVEDGKLGELMGQFGQMVRGGSGGGDVAGDGGRGVGLPEVDEM